MAQLITGLNADRVRAARLRLEREIASAGERAAGGRAPARMLAATKYVAAHELKVLAQAGVELVGENRAQDLEHKAAEHGELFEWHFIGQLQSRRVRQIVPYVKMIHSVASESALRELGRHLDLARAGLRMLIEVNVSGEPGKAGVEPEELDALIAHSPVPVARADDDAAAGARPRGQPTVVPRAASARRRARPGAALDGDHAGLRRRRRGGRHNRAHRHGPL